MAWKYIHKELNNRDRIFGLDVLRAFAILIIVYEHGNFLLENVSPRLASLKIVDGVDLFFVLSGFLIGNLLLQRLTAENKVTFKVVKSFLIRRWFRTLPNYYLFLLLNIILVGLHLTPGTIEKHLMTFFVFMQNLWKPYDFLYWESWSLSVEEWFYLLFPFSLLTLWTIFRRNIKWIFIFTAFLFIIFSTLLRFNAQLLGHDNYPGWDLFIRKIVLMRLDSLGFGLCACWIATYYNVLWKRCANFCFIIGAFIFGGIMGISHTHLQFYQTWYFSLSGIAAMMWLPLAEQWKQPLSGLGKIWTFISLISYSLYLINHGIVASLIKHNSDYGNHPFLFYVIYLASSIGLSAFIFNYFEKPITNLRDKFNTTKTK